MALDLVFIGLLAAQTIYLFVHDLLKPTPRTVGKDEDPVVFWGQGIAMRLGNALPSAIALAFALKYQGAKTPTDVAIYYGVYFVAFMVMLGRAWRHDRPKIRPLRLAVPSLVLANAALAVLISLHGMPWFAS